MLGSGKPIDTDRWYVIFINSLGSCKGPTGSYVHMGEIVPW